MYKYDRGTKEKKTQFHVNCTTTERVDTTTRTRIFIKNKVVTDVSQLTSIILTIQTAEDSVVRVNRTDDTEVIITRLTLSHTSIIPLSKSPLA